MSYQLLVVLQTWPPIYRHINCHCTFPPTANTRTLLSTFTSSHHGCPVERVQTAAPFASMVSILNAKQEWSRTRNISSQATKVYETHWYRWTGRGDATRLAAEFATPYIMRNSPVLKLQYHVIPPIPRSSRHLSHSNNSTVTLLTNASYCQHHLTSACCCLLLPAIASFRIRLAL